MEINKEEFIKLYDRWVSILARYPVLFNFMRDMGSLKQLFNCVPKELVPDDIDPDANIEKHLEQSKAILDVMEKIEKEIPKQEQQNKYDVPVYNYNIDLVIEHARKIESLNLKIQYLLMVMNYYRRHLYFRDNCYKDHIVDFQKITSPMDMMASLYSITEIAMKEKNIDDIPFVLNKETFEERIHLEIQRLTDLQAKTNGENYNDILEAINNPPGTKRRELPANETDEESDGHPGKEFITKKEAMEMLGVSATSIYNYQKQNLLKPYKFSRKNYYKRSDITRLIEGK